MYTGVFKRGTLLETWTPAEIDTALTAHALHRLRYGWYALPTAHQVVRDVVRRGGVVTCLTALAMHGAWTPPDGGRVHLRGNSATARLHPQWCRRFGRQPPEDEAVDDVLTALEHAARCLPTEDFIVVCDSALNRRLISFDELEYALRHAPRRVQRALRKVDGRAESGTETMVRLRLAAPNLVITPQVHIVGVGRVDLLVGTSLIIEVDGQRWHSGAQFEEDRRRDLYAQVLGYRVVRLSYHQVVDEWETVGPLIHDLISRGDHRRPIPSAA